MDLDIQVVGEKPPAHLQAAEGGGHARSIFADRRPCEDARASEPPPSAAWRCAGGFSPTTCMSRSTPDLPGFTPGDAAERRGPGCRGAASSARYPAGMDSKREAGWFPIRSPLGRPPDLCSVVLAVIFVLENRRSTTIRFRSQRSPRPCGSLSSPVWWWASSPVAFWSTAAITSKPGGSAHLASTPSPSVSQRDVRSRTR